MRFLARLILVAAVGGLPFGGTKAIEATDPPTIKNADSTTAAPARDELFKRFTEQMAGVKLVGRFTVLGKENEKLAAEEYRILSVVKMDDGDYWLLTARIKYGKNDVTVPMPLQIKWAGETPVITLDKVTIPGLGTFSARVLFHENMYTGTWIHDKVGGHLFGTVEKLKPEELAAEKKAPAAKP